MAARAEVCVSMTLFKQRIEIHNALRCSYKTWRCGGYMYTSSMQDITFCSHILHIQTSQGFFRILQLYRRHYEHWLFAIFFFFMIGDLIDNFLSPSSKLSRIVTTSKLTQVIDKPTRVTPTSATFFDVVITNMPNIISDSYIIPGVVADHDLIGVFVDISKPKGQPVTKTKRDLRNYSSENLCTHNSNETLKLIQILHKDNVNKQVLLLTWVMTDNINQCGPMTNVTLRRPTAPWINNEVKEAILERKRAQKLLKENRHNILLQQKFKEIKRRVKGLMNST